VITPPCFDDIATDRKPKTGTAVCSIARGLDAPAFEEVWEDVRRYARPESPADHDVTIDRITADT
jgi:hypothetical protein